MPVLDGFYRVYFLRCNSFVIQQLDYPKQVLLLLATRCLRKGMRISAHLYVLCLAFVPLSRCSLHSCSLAALFNDRALFLGQISNSIIANLGNVTSKHMSKIL